MSSTYFGAPLLAVALLACSGAAQSKVQIGAAGLEEPASGGGVNLSVASTSGLDGTAGSSAIGGANGADQVISMLPAGFFQTDVGGYRLGAPLGVAGAASGTSTTGGTAGSGSFTVLTGNCGNVLYGVVRDFKGSNQPGGHPDFEANMYGNDVTPNLLTALLGADQKPVYASRCELGHPSPLQFCPFGAETTTLSDFEQWYRDTAEVNLPYGVSLYLAPQPGGLFTFQSLYYFPLDGAGFGNSAVGDDGKLHNFSFTTEVHTQFAYSGGEAFQFQGDDDVWVFINGKLAVDLGGLHPKTLRNVSLDAAAATLGISVGNVYPLDLFHAERHTSQSTFRIDTNLSFVDCGAATSSVVK